MPRILRAARLVLPWAPNGDGKRRRRRNPSIRRSLPELSDQEPSKCGRLDDEPDVEALPLRRRNLVATGAHAMNRELGQPAFGHSYSNVDKAAEPETADLLKFYDEQVLALQNKAGDQDHAPIGGNLYRYMALRKFGEDSGLFQEKATPMLLAGLYAIAFIQVSAPVFISIWVKSQVVCATQEGCFTLNAWRYEYGSEEYGISNFSGRVLALLFIILFCMNGAFNFQREEDQMGKTLDMAAIFDAAASSSSANNQHDDYPPTMRLWLWLDPFVNIWCFSITAVNLVFILGVAKGPKDIVYDAFALLFLFNLDDVGGDLAFLDDKWDEDQFGDIFGQLADQTAADDASEGALLVDIREARHSSFTPDNFFKLGKKICFLMLVVLPILYFVLDLKIDTGKGVSVTQDEFQKLKHTVAELKAQLAAHKK